MSYYAGQNCNYNGVNKDINEFSGYKCDYNGVSKSILTDADEKREAKYNTPD